MKSLLARIGEHRYVVYVIIETDQASQVSITKRFIVYTLAIYFQVVTVVSVQVGEPGSTEELL